VIGSGKKKWEVLSGREIALINLFLRGTQSGKRRQERKRKINEVEIPQGGH